MVEAHEVKSGLSTHGEQAYRPAMVAESNLTSGQFSALQEIAMAGPLHGVATSFDCLGVLLRLNFIQAESDGYAPTEAGLSRIAIGL
jgi:hypothetical protein